jgi:hypothetical protein
MPAPDHPAHDPRPIPGHEPVVGRRRVLAGLAGAAAGTLAGCGSGPGPGLAPAGAYYGVSRRS